ncbi:MAG: DUF4058 family protein [Synechococcales bacterium]|nr:DUF4058 family protein [Synechococcales bacterium]
MYGFNLPEPIPQFALPLRSSDSEPIIDLHALLNIVYDRAGYAFAIDYTQAPIPKLSDDLQAWSQSVLQTV